MSGGGVSCAGRKVTEERVEGYRWLMVAVVVRCLHGVGKTEVDKEEACRGGGRRPEGREGMNSGSELRRLRCHDCCAVDGAARDSRSMWLESTAMAAK